MHAPRLLASLLLAGLAAGCAIVPSPPTDPPRDPLPEPIEAVATRDGIGVSLIVDRSRVAAGGDVTATVTVRNLEPGVVTWQGGGCDLQGDFSIEPAAPIPAPPVGEPWDGDKLVIKQLALQDAYAVRGPAPVKLAHVDVAFGCTSDLRFNELQPGEEAKATVVWVASTPAGSPAPAGDYLVSVRFPFMGRGLAGPPMDFEMARDVKPIVAQLVVTVDDHPPVPSAVDAMDAVLGDAAFTAWLEDHPRQIWNTTAIRWIDGAWVVQVQYQPDRMLSARHDPATDKVTLSEGPAPNLRP